MKVVGPWWLAQRGMAGLVRDLVQSFLLSCLLVVPLVALALPAPARARWRALPLAALPNVLPLLTALGFLAWSGLGLRIATAMILAVALGIAVDDTIHLACRLGEESRRNREPAAVIAATLHGSGRALVATTAVLVTGFASMASSDLLAVRDMGIVGAVTLTAALAADLLFLPPLYALAQAGGRAPRADSTTSDAQEAMAPAGR